MLADMQHSQPHMTLYRADIFFGILHHNIFPALIHFCFDTAEPTQRLAVLFLTSNTSWNKQSGFIALEFLTVTEGLGDIVLLPVHISIVETIADSRIAFYCYWSSHLPADLNNYLKFSRNLCLYIALLHKNWSIPIVTIFFVGLNATTL